MGGHGTPEAGMSRISRALYSAALPLAVAGGHLVAAAFGRGELSVEPAFVLLTLLASAVIFAASYTLHDWAHRLAPAARHAAARTGRMRRLASPVVWMPVIIAALALIAHLLNQS
ncbi:hypothetical protein SAMN05216212_1973 [Microbulbifer yueqingensis]|uniref:Uncharacterized protein n=2 Tax=Microbulbifer yueqingensis TaxID=658219 RepID=A0A1G9AEF3_9GAMM|nr:hypothetical protein SAMN05216212_1973 [Microbulbifer yueqingensis]